MVDIVERMAVTAKAFRTRPDDAFEWMAAMYAEGAAEITALRQQLEEAREALVQIEQWTEAYPKTVFPEPDFAKVRELLEAGGITLDSVSASNMRHVLKGVAGIVSPAIRALGVSTFPHGADPKPHTSQTAQS